MASRSPAPWPQHHLASGFGRFRAPHWRVCEQPVRGHRCGLLYKHTGIARRILYLGIAAQGGRAHDQARDCDCRIDCREHRGPFANNDRSMDSTLCEGRSGCLRILRARCSGRGSDHANSAPPTFDDLHSGRRDRKRFGDARIPLCTGAASGCTAAPRGHSAD